MKKFVIYFICAQFIFQPLGSANTRSDIQMDESVEAPTHAIDTRLAQELSRDQFIDAFEKENDIPLDLGLSSDDPTLDENPFFLRNQRWLPLNSTSNTANEEINKISVSVPQIGKALEIPQPLNPILETDEFLFFSAKEHSQLFEKASIGLEQTSEGVFFISRSDLLNHSYQNLPVPVFYLPMPDTGWQGDITAASFEDHDLVVFADQDDNAIPVKLDDIRQVMKAERMNLFLAQAFSFGQNPMEDISDLRQVIPAPHMTAGFGVLFTGIVKDNLADSLFAVKGPFSIQQAVAQAMTFIQQNFLPKAQADGFTLDPHLIKRLIRVGIVVAVALVASVTLKMTLYKKYFAEKHEKEGSSGKGGIKRTINDIGDVFAHTLTTFNQFSSVWFANGVEFLSDRYFPQLASANNTAIRKFLNKTVYFVRSANERIPVSAKTWLFGAVILGGIDVFFIGVQLYAVVPWLGNAIAGKVHWMASRAQEAFALGNPRTATINENEMIRNAASYITSGASSFSSDLQSQLVQKVQVEIQEQMRREGKDSDSSQYASEFKKRVDNLLDQDMQKLGVPSKDQFLFDANSLYFNSVQVLGYGLPKAVKENSQIDPSKFVTLARPGLNISSVRTAIKKLESESNSFSLDSHSGNHVAEALSLLKEGASHLSLLSAFTKAPMAALLDQKDHQSYKDKVKSYVSEVKAARQTLTILSYTGNIEDVVEFLPESWKKADPQAVKLAASTYLDAVSLNVNGPEAETPYVPPKKDSLARKQELKAIRLASEDFLQAKGYTFNAAVATEDEIGLFKELYSKHMNQNLGLKPYYSEDPQLETNIIKKAKEYSQSQLNQSDIKAYLTQLSAEKRVEFESSLYSANFVKAYKEVIIKSGAISILSPAQPGRLQGLRQRDTFKNNMILTRLARGFESMFAGDQLEPGRKAWMSRNIPGFYDVMQSNKRIYAGALTKATAGYLFGFVVWGINLPAYLWTLALVTGFTVGAPSQFLTRFFNYQGWKPMGKITMMGMFALIYTWATFWGTIPQQIFAGDFEKAFNFIVKQHGIEAATLTAAAIALFKSKDKITESARDFKERVRGRIEDFKENCAVLMGRTHFSR